MASKRVMFSQINKSKLKYLYGSDVPFAKMALTKEGAYSVTPKFQRDQIIQIMTNVLPDNLSKYSIVDGTSGNGGDLISFSKYFKRVKGIEYDPENYEATVHNMKVIGATNVTLKNGNTINEFSGMSEDILFLDPKWGGKSYKEQEFIKLSLDSDGGSTIEIGLILRAIMSQRQIVPDIKPDVFFVKVPTNADLSVFPLYSIYNIFNEAGRVSFLLIVGSLNGQIDLKEAPLKYKQ